MNYIHCRTCLLSLLVGLCLYVPGLADVWYTTNVEQWGVFEATRNTSIDYPTPINVTWRGTFTSPSGKKFVQEGFWDGGKTYKLRFRPNELGKWRFSMMASNTSDFDLSWIGGEFECIEYSGENNIQKRGYLKTSANNRYLTYNDGTPFFWLGDNTWAHALRAIPDDTKILVANRKERNYNVLALQMLGCYELEGPRQKNRYGETPFVNYNYDSINPEFFKPIDSMITIMNANDITAFVNIVWTSMHSNVHEPPSSVWWRLLTVEQAERLSNYVARRFAAYHVVWCIGADAPDTSFTQKQYVRRLAQATKNGDAGANLVTSHPAGWMSTYDIYPYDSWLDFHCVHSSHASRILYGAYYLSTPVYYIGKPKPFINEEACFETIIDEWYANPTVIRRLNDYHVRKAQYYSLFSGTFGVMYGANGLWQWTTPIANWQFSPVANWDSLINLPGGYQMKHLQELATAMPWYRMSPYHEGVIHDSLPNVDATLEPHGPVPRVLAMKKDNNSLLVVYAPNNDTIKIRTAGMKNTLSISFMNPKTGEWLPSKDTVANEGHIILRRPAELGVDSLHKDFIAWIENVSLSNVPGDDDLTKSKVFPIPASSYAIFEFHNISGNSAQLTIFDGLGKEVSSFNVIPTEDKEVVKEISTASFLSGLYFAELTDMSGNKKRLKFIVNN